jgi:hypothetical protein
MFKKYLKIALRNLVRHKVLSVVQLLGLIVALSFSFVIVLFIWTELSYDKFYKNADRIYRVIDVRTFAGQMSEGVGGPMPLAPTLTSYFSEIECATRVCTYEQEIWPSIISHLKKRNFFSLIPVFSKYFPVNFFMVIHSPRYQNPMEW